MLKLNKLLARKSSALEYLIILSALLIVDLPSNQFELIIIIKRISFFFLAMLGIGVLSQTLYKSTDNSQDKKAKKFLFYVKLILASLLLICGLQLFQQSTDKLTFIILLIAIFCFVLRKKIDHDKKSIYLLGIANFLAIFFNVFLSFFILSRPQLLPVLMIALSFAAMQTALFLAEKIKSTDISDFELRLPAVHVLLSISIIGFMVLLQFLSFFYLLIFILLIFVFKMTPKKVDIDVENLKISIYNQTNYAYSTYFVLLVIFRVLL